MRKKFSNEIETGQALARISNANFMTLLLRDNGNSEFESLLDSRQIGQVSKLSRESVRVMVTSTNACEELDCQSVTALSDKFLSEEFETLDRRYYLDALGTGLEVEREGILQSLHEKKCGILLDTFQEANSSKVVLLSTWRVTMRLDVP